MKKALFFIGLSLCISIYSAYSQNLGSLNYVKMSSFSSNNRINITSLNDYIKLINDNNIKTILMGNNVFAFEINSTLYTLSANKYTTLNDFLDGQNKQFKDGDSYYFAKENNLTDQLAVDNYKHDEEEAKKLYFNSITEYRDALNSGFINLNGNVYLDEINGFITKEVLQNNIYYANIIFAVSDINNKDISKLPVKQYNSNYYYISYRCRLSIDSSSGNKRLLYYIAKLAQFQTLNEVISARSSGVVHIKGTDNISKELGFKNYNDCSKAIREGFDNSNQYYIATSYGMTREQYISNLEFINELENIKKDYNLAEGTRFALTIYHILKCEKNKNYSSSIFINENNQSYANKNSGSGLQNWRLAPVADVYIYSDKIKKLIEYNPMNGAFRLK
jgi:hypothetical protein